MKFALISTHGIHKAQIKLDCREGDCTSFLNLVDVFKGFHFNYEKLQQEDHSYLKDFDLVMMSGDCKYIVDIIRIAKMLKDSNAVSMFYPEGSSQLYENSIRGFHKEYYEAWNACDILSIVEEDKQAYYESFVSSDTLVRFIHVPITKEMSSGDLFVPRQWKQPYAVVYGDNNPNHPLIAVAVAKKIGIEVLAIEMGEIDNVKQVAEVVRHPKISVSSKLSQRSFLDSLGRSLIHIYPTEWIGTARQVISCAAVGTPCIGNMHSHTQQRLFPDLKAWIYDIDKMTELGDKLVSDNSFYSKVVTYAFNNIQFYNIENTTKRFMDALSLAQEAKSSRKATMAVA